MSAQHLNNSTENKVNIGNASNPGPKDEGFVSSANNQLLDEKAEKYLREAGNIEDMPDAEENEGLEKESK